jgi:hypothetical protein
MNMAEEAPSAYIWCSRITSRSIEYKKAKKLDMWQYNMLEGRPIRSSWVMLSPLIFCGRAKNADSVGAKNG